MTVVLKSFDRDAEEAWCALEWGLRCTLHTVYVQPDHGKPVRYMTPSRFWLVDQDGRKIDVDGTFSSYALVEMMQAVRERVERETMEVVDEADDLRDAR